LLLLDANWKCVTDEKLFVADKMTFISKPHKALHLSLALTIAALSPLLHQNKKEL
jgi:hypothetical protein